MQIIAGVSPPDQPEIVTPALQPLVLRLPPQILPRLGRGPRPVDLPHGLRRPRAPGRQAVGRRGPEGVRLQARDQGPAGRRLLSARS